MKVLVIPEDPTLDQYILKPIVERLLADLGKQARVQVLSRPRLRGIAQALDATIIADIIQTYPMVDLFLIMVDRHPKERYAHPFLAERAPKLDPGQGRAWAMRELPGKWKGVLSACDELEGLKHRLHEWMQQGAGRA